ncbi:YkgJ family cysteine cluster protein [Candidatus Woesearchaeota archaeon]|nr:YkgJ family cysteine cluster protein [Candidatus Woesearchaeota archaeon]MBW3006453.1 YkgJ family cysteine cluster protein [Candidatus Woesearchaeota archaeon]
MKNNYWSKFIRTLTCLLPVSKNRTGKCINCGECCKLPNKCIFLRYDKNGKSSCLIHPIRPLNCRKYPRTEKEYITKETCGFSFQK